MKITLEFEYSDLRNMVENHFTNEGFIVKNLDDICNAFGAAFPGGLRVEADIAPAPVVPARKPSRFAAAEDDAAPPTMGAGEDGPLTLDNLRDPTPRKVRMDTAWKNPSPSAAVTGIERLIKESRALEKEV